MGRVKDLHNDLLREAIERMDAEMEAGGWLALTTEASTHVEPRPSGMPPMPTRSRPVGDAVNEPGQATPGRLGT
jgi:hypothetical protein